MKIEIIKNELVIRIPIRKIEQTVVGRQQELTKREQDVFGLMIQGKNAKDVAQELNITPRTGQLHICNVMKKYGCSNRVEFAAAVRNIGG